MKQIPGSVIGGSLLIAGSCIGAGMLALPILLGILGFFPSLIIILVAWGFMTYTGLLIIEINGWFYGQINIISMAKEAFGKTGKIISWVLYLFLFYSLLVAYLAGSGSLFISFLPFEISAKVASIFFVCLFGIIVYFNTRCVDLVNRFLMAGLIISYIMMIVLGISKVKANLYLHVDMKYFLLPLSVLITSFGFHNMIPSLTAYMKGDLKRTRKAIITGSFLALLVYFFWIFLVLGVVPVEGSDGLLNAFVKGYEATIPLSEILKKSIVSSFAKWLAFFAIVTSFLAQSLGLMHFIADGLKVKSNKTTNWWLVLLAVVPPGIFGISFPNVFYKALGYAGAYSAVVLFGIFPALMVWIGRYYKKETTAYHVKGGKTSLILIMVVSLIIIFNQFIQTIKG